MTIIRLPGLTNPVDTSDPIYPGSHFTWGEATKNGNRIPQQTIFRGVTIPGSQITRNIMELAKELDKIRSEFGDRPITVTSWYRDPQSNRAVGGAGNSHHLLGWAADIQIKGIPSATVADRLSERWQGGLGDSRSFTHVDLRHKMGWQSARWDYGNA
jgi:hypothetical protein